jgi:hypothetical protein
MEYMAAEEAVKVFVAVLKLATKELEGVCIRLKGTLVTSLVATVVVTTDNSTTNHKFEPPTPVQQGCVIPLCNMFPVMSMSAKTLTLATLCICMTSALTLKKPMGLTEMIPKVTLPIIGVVKSSPTCKFPTTVKFATLGEHRCMSVHSTTQGEPLGVVSVFGKKMGLEHFN